MSENLLTHPSSVATFAHATRPLWQQPLLMLVVALLALLVVHAATVTEVVSIWSNNGAYRFSWIIVPTFAYLLWHNRAQFKSYQPSGSLLGIVLAIVGALLWIAGELINIALLRQLALLVGIVAVVLAGTGRPLFVALFPTLILLIFLVPLGDLLVTPLKFFLINFTRGFAALAGLPFARDGFSFFIGNNEYTVIDACTGLAYVLSGLFLGLTFALLIYRTGWKILVLTLLGGGLGMLANGLRVCGIVLYDHISGSQMEVPDHAYFEYLAVPLCFSVLFIVFSRLNAERQTGSGAIQQADVPQMVLTVKSAAATLIAVALLSVAPVVSRGMPATAHDSKAELLLPESLGSWHKQLIEPQWKPKIRSSGVLQSLASYATIDRTISVFVAQPASHMAKISAGSVSLVGAKGWLPGGIEGTELCRDGNCVEVLKYTLRRTKGEGVRYVYSTYILDTQVIVSPLRLRVQRAWNHWRGVASKPYLIAIMQDATQSARPAELADIFFTLVAPGPHRPLTYHIDKD